MGKKRVIQKSSESTEAKPASEAKSHRVGAQSQVQRGIAHVQATYNNTIISISNEAGDVLAWSSAGSLGFSGAKKATPFAAARVAEAVVEKVRKTGLREVMVRVSGVGSGRDSAVRALANQGLDVIGVKDITPLPHNGPRAKKVRRV